MIKLRVAISLLFGMLVAMTVSVVAMAVVAMAVDGMCILVFT